MFPFDVPSTQWSREILTLGIIISAMVYGGVATLVLTYISLLLKTSHTISRRLRNFLLAYVVFMVAISTVNIVTLIIAFTIGRNIFPFGSSGTGNMIHLLTFPNGMAGALCVTFASWGADGFMVSLFIQVSRKGVILSLFVLAMAVCGVIWGNFSTSSIGNFDCYYPPGNDIIWYAHLIKCLFCLLTRTRLLYISSHQRK